MASSLDPKMVSSVLMQTTPHQQHNPNWPGYGRANEYFDYLEKHPDAQRDSIGWAGNMGSALANKSNPQLVPYLNSGIYTEGSAPSVMNDFRTPQRVLDFNKGPSFWNTAF